MPAFLKVRRNQLIIGGVLILLLVLLGLFIFLPRSKPTSPTSSAGTATVTPSPSPDLSPSPSPSPNASASPVASPTGVAPIPPGPPGIGPAGAFLHSGPAPDDSSNPLWGQNSDPAAAACSAGGTWHHAGWESQACQLVILGGTTAESMAWVVERKVSTPNQQRVSVLKGTSGPWVTALYFIDTTCCSFTSMTVRSADITGDGRPEIIVGIRSATINHVLQIDAVRRTGPSDPLVIIHRELVNGKAVLGSGNGFTDFGATGDQYAKTVITYGGSSFSGTSSTVSAAPAGDFP